MLQPISHQHLQISRFQHINCIRASLCLWFHKASLSHIGSSHNLNAMIQSACSKGWTLSSYLPFSCHFTAATHTAISLISLSVMQSPPSLRCYGAAFSLTCWRKQNEGEQYPKFFLFSCNGGIMHCTSIGALNNQLPMNYNSLMQGTNLKWKAGGAAKTSRRFWPPDIVHL